MKLSPLLKGLITAVLMMAVSLIVLTTEAARYTLAGYSIYILYAGGIAWTLLAYSRSPDFTGKFADTFQKGFRCFIVITLLMVFFTAILFSSHPEWAEESSKAYTEFATKEGNTPHADIARNATKIKEGFVTTNVSTAVFGYLMTGAIFTAIGAALLTARKQ